MCAALSTASHQHGSELYTMCGTSEAKLKNDEAMLNLSMQSLLLKTSNFFI